MSATKSTRNSKLKAPSAPPLQIVILAGGTGSRLWPLSRQAHPKQFQKLTGKQTLFQLAVARARKVARPENIFVSTNAQFVATVKKQAPQIPSKNVLAEPAFRDTATCLGYAATVLENRAPGGVMAVLYADHLISDEAELTRKLRAAAEVASAGKFAIIEVKSLFPATQFGWVETGAQLPAVRGEEVLSFKKFIEKPNLATAEKLHRQHNFFWNTGLYVWRTDKLLAEIAAHLPETGTHLSKISAKLNDKKLLEKEYSACQKISIDYGVMEKIAKSEVVILPADLGWSDVGNWAALKDELSSSTENLVLGNHLGVETHGCLIQNHGKKLITTLGLRDIIIVDTGDALLIAAKSHAGELKKLVEKLPKNLE